MEEENCGAIRVYLQTYRSVFVVQLDQQEDAQRVSYSYADVLTETVELTFTMKFYN